MLEVINKQSTVNIGIVNDLKKRLFFLLGALIVFRIGAHIPVPGVDIVKLTALFERANANGGIFGMLNMFSGGSLERFSLFAIGIIPYISASIVIQLASEVVPSLKSLKKEGELGKRTLTKYTRIATLILASVQSFFAALLVYQQGVVVLDKVEFFVSAVVCLVTGTMFLMWLGEQITERGIGNGISLIITAGIIATLPGTIGQLFSLTADGAISYFVVLLILIGALLLIYAVVFFESAQRKIPIHYAKRQVNHRLSQNQNMYMPFKLNMAGVIPPIFASSIILFPSQIMSWVAATEHNGFWANVAVLLSHGQPLYIIIFSVAIIFFCYFYTALVFSPREMSDNLKKSGAFVPGIRPGEQTSSYLEKVVLRLTFFGALYITVICIIPEFITGVMKVPIYLGGTSLLILVVVTMDFANQIASYRMNQKYEHLLRKADSKKL